MGAAPTELHLLISVPVAAINLVAPNGIVQPPVTPEELVVSSASQGFGGKVGFIAWADVGLAAGSDDSDKQKVGVAVRWCAVGYRSKIRANTKAATWGGTGWRYEKRRWRCRF